MKTIIFTATEQEARDKVKALGFTVTKVTGFSYNFASETARKDDYVQCFAIDIKEDGFGFIVNSRTGEVDRSNVFWNKYGGKAASGPFLTLKVDLTPEDLSQAEVQRRGFTPTSVSNFQHGILGSGSVTCYLIGVKEKVNAFIVRGDTGQVYDSIEFWEKYGDKYRTSRYGEEE